MEGGWDILLDNTKKIPATSQSEFRVPGLPLRCDLVRQDSAASTHVVNEAGSMRKDTGNVCKSSGSPCSAAAFLHAHLQHRLHMVTP